MDHHSPSFSRLSLREVVEVLASPYASEQFSSLTGSPVLIAEFDRADADIDNETLEQTRRRLRELPCPTVVIGDENVPGAAIRLREAFDIALADDTDLGAILETVRRAPLAATGMVQVLRQGESLSIHEGLIAESMIYSVLQNGPEYLAWLEAREPVPAAAIQYEGKAVLSLRDGARLNITLNRPERHNAFSAEMRDELVEALRVVIADPTIEEVVLRGAGPSFSSGGDLDEFGTLPDSATAHLIRSTRNVGRILSDCADRVRVEVQGACVGAGVELPAFAARVSARPDAYFWLPEVVMGLVPGAGGTVSIPRRIGRQRTNLFALRGTRIDAETALGWGLIDEIL